MAASGAYSAVFGNHQQAWRDSDLAAEASKLEAQNLLVDAPLVHALRSAPEPPEPEEQTYGFGLQQW